MPRLPERLLGLMAAAGLSGCAAFLPGPSLPALPLLPPAALGETRSAGQTLDIAFADQQLDVQAAVQVDPQSLSLIALGPLGTRVLTLRYDGRSVVTERAPQTQLPAQFPPERVLADLELALWPLAAWQRALAGSGWQLDEPQPGLRRLRWRGQLAAEVHVAEPRDPWTSRLWLVNFADRYSLTILPDPPSQRP